MRILIAGGTGFLGPALVDSWIGQGHAVTALVRDPLRASTVLPHQAILVRWNGGPHDDLQGMMARTDAVINLSGVSIGEKRWSEKRKAIILASRVDTTRALVAAMRTAQPRPSVFLNASAVGYYGMSGPGDVTEHADPGRDFLAATCRQWEDEALAARDRGIRVVLPRMGVVLGAGGGALERMMLPFTLFVGGPLGSGTQWVPWVHRDDVIAAIQFVFDHPEFQGPFNLVAPGIVNMATFSKEIGRALGRPSWMPVPSVFLKWAFGEMSGIILEGRHIVPARLQEAGYAFRYPDVRQALRSILA
jgi:uncharacterized protein (TIGR01777 family)